VALEIRGKRGRIRTRYLGGFEINESIESVGTNN